MADNGSNQTDSKSLERQHENVLWFVGDFEGEFSGQLKKADDSTAAPRYDISIKKGVVRNARRISGPPASIEIDDPVIQQDVVNDVLIGPDEAGKYFSFSADNFRLYEWRQLAEKQIFSGEASELIGRLEGKSYFSLPRSRSKPAPDPAKIPDPEKASGSVKASGSATASDSAKEPDRKKESGPAKNNVPARRECLVCNTLLNVIASLTLWWICDWHSALLFFTVTWTACWLSRTKSKSFPIESPAWRSIILVVSIAISSTGVALIGQAECQPAFLSWFILLPLVSLLLMVVLWPCWQKGILLFLWFLFVLIGCGACQSESGSWSDYLSHFMTRQTNSPVTETAVEQVEARRVSIDDALRNPASVENGENSIYFPDAALFPTNSSDVSNMGEYELQKLSKLLESYPGYKVRIIGHTDQQGDSNPAGMARNYELSQKRAEAVADWLLDHGSDGKNQLDMIGMGAQSPIVRDLKNPSRAENRRVEVKLIKPFDANASNMQLVAGQGSKKPDLAINRKITTKLMPSNQKVESE